ncbi:hypothetical protein NKH77_17610 [Streptomyces sp. M19]
MTADVVLRLLADRRTPVVRLDPGTDLHMGASLTATYRTGGQRAPCARQAGRSTPTSSGPSGFAGPRRTRARRAERPGPPVRRGTSPVGRGRHPRVTAGSALRQSPWNNRAAEFKPAQLSTARRCGFLVPSTVITNDPTRRGRSPLVSPTESSTSPCGTRPTTWTTSHTASGSGRCARRRSPTP